PLTAKVPPGYTIPGATSDCHYVRHLGSEVTIGVNRYPAITLYDAGRGPTYAKCYVEIGPWPDGQPSIWFYIERNYDVPNGRTLVDIYYYGTPLGDTRAYPITLYWGPYQILSDHRSLPARWIYHSIWGAQIGQKSNKYFIRTEDQVALKLCQAEPWAWKLNNWCGQLWGDTHADIHAPLFNKGHEKNSDHIYQPGYPMYQDCLKNHQGCPNDWPADMYRGTSTAGWGFSHRSKVCVWPQAYTWVLAQDPLGLLAQAVHTLIKTNNPWHQFYSAWPAGAVTPQPASFTPIGIAEWVMQHFYRPGVGVSMFQAPVIGQDNRASSLRTNQFLILTTLLGYRYLIGNWHWTADDVAWILRNTSIGGPGQPAYGVRTAEGDVHRPDYYGAQLFVWDWIDGQGIGLTGFSWLRTAINHYLNLPYDDTDWMLSTVETTATYCQALRTYGYHKYGWQFGPLATIPGA
ncbi:MAG TPA: hypothetical protein VNK95_04655, partial [Caldilineaceae bacterium]|nr:hypothetical protein [Caldilineaceae bacterium]